MGTAGLDVEREKVVVADDHVLLVVGVNLLVVAQRVFELTLAGVLAALLNGDLELCSVRMGPL